MGVLARLVMVVAAVLLVSPLQDNLLTLPPLESTSNFPDTVKLTVLLFFFAINWICFSALFFCLSKFLTMSAICFMYFTTVIRQSPVLFVVVATVLFLAFFLVDFNPFFLPRDFLPFLPFFLPFLRDFFPFLLDFRLLCEDFLFLDPLF